MPKLLLVEQYFFPKGGGAEIPRILQLGLREAGFEVDRPGHKGSV